jgi:thiamine biosynthesis lipoprotein ApbE
MTLPQPVQFHFHHDNILGTSLDLVVVASHGDEADACEQAVLDEIERLRRILSTYDPASDISRLNRERGPVPCPPELIEVLRAYEHWQRWSGGAFNGQLGGLIRLWKEAEKAGAPPDAAILSQLVYQINQPGWRIDEARGSVERLTDQALNVNAIGKGYILGKAAAAARAKIPSVQGLLINLGGDVHVWGDGGAAGAGWRIGVADPWQPEDNAAPLVLLRLRDRAVATSASYERFYTVAGRRYSHVLDPRTGRPAEGIASATVVAADNVTANALATSLCVLSPEEGLALIKATPGAECLLVAADGRQLRSDGWKRLELPLSRAADDKKAGKWPAGYQVSITLQLPTPTTGKKIKRPYVAVWIEDADGKPVRTITVWGNEAKYLKDLTAWWQFARDDRDLIKAVSRATRQPGRYQLVWDGTDDKGKPVAQGTYKVVVEVHREHGKHVKQTGTILCGTDKASTKLEKTAESEETQVTYGPKGK